MTSLNRRAAVRAASLATVATVTGASAAEASLRYQMMPQRTVRPSGGATRQVAPAPAVVVQGTTEILWDEPSVKLSFAGHRGASISNAARTVTAHLRQVPVSLTIANDGNRALPAGAEVLVRSVLVDDAGLVTGSRQPVLVVGAHNRLNGLIGFSQRPDASVMTLPRGLAPGATLTVDMKLELAARLTQKQVRQVQLLAVTTVSFHHFGYFEAQSPEALMSAL
ncbi:MAG: hypothetical protein Q4A03_00235 [Rothia sp. (in: high G+C Gram-positive bacteria)]|uniref:hypothetical protein n=1 Tax=Rothia sp. (in: high G+C Gram-positive bacteria) TaxID=1885016 RepID=UPI00270F8780|nr:hypothetical protein [Rothia sp. (in: high G+C Gram-positive bacteria)]